MKKTAVFVCLLLVSSLVLTTAAVTAKKPENPGGGGGGAGPTGTIFFSMADDNGVGHIWTVAPDGSGLTKRTMRGDGVVSLSWGTHNDHYWYVGLVTIDGETYPDGQPRKEIYAIRDDNTMGFWMTDDGNMEFPPPGWLGSQPVWVPGDAYISWPAKSWADQGDGTYAYDYGIFRAEVQHYASGDVSGLGDPELAYDTGSYYYEQDDVYFPNVHGYDWNPDGDKLALQKHDNYIYIDDIYGNSPTQLTNGWEPKWSPDGAKIAFLRSKELLVIDVDGTDETSLDLMKDFKVTVKGIRGHAWSPDSKYLVYTGWSHCLRNWAFKSTMYTIKPDGSGRSSISVGVSVGTGKTSRDWR